MTPEQIAAARARCEAATPGPWKLDKHFQCYIWGPQMQMVADDGNPPADAKDQITRMRGVGADLPLEKNGDFIAHARTDLPMALDAVAAKDAKIAKLKATELFRRKAFISDARQFAASIKQRDARIAELIQENSEMARMLAGREYENQELKARIAELERENQNLLGVIESANNSAKRRGDSLKVAREAIERAPCSLGCKSIEKRSRDCDCWKREALAAIDEALAPKT